MENFLPWNGLAGGILIGLAAGLYLLAVGRVAGVSGILENLLRPATPGHSINAAFVVGLPIGGLLVWLLAPGLVPQVSMAGGPAVAIVAGLLVGLGSRIGGGCTSGHGVCGIPRLSIRSIVATGTFMATAAATVFVIRHTGLGG